MSSTQHEMAAELRNAATAVNNAWKNALEIDPVLSSQSFVFTAHEVLTFSSSAASLHIGEYPAKVHWPNVKAALSNPTCNIVNDVLGHDVWALVDICTVRSQAASGNIKFEEMLSILERNAALQETVQAYLIATIKYFTNANVYRVWGEKASKMLMKMNLNLGGVEVLKISHPSPHGNRGSDNHHRKVIYDLQCVLARTRDPLNWEAELGLLQSAEQEKVLQHRKELQEIEICEKTILAAAPSILHLVEEDWTKRITFSKWLSCYGVSKDVRNAMFLQSLRNVKPDSAAIIELAAKLEISVPVLWKTCVAGGNSAVLRVVDSPEKVSTSLEVLAAKLGISVPVLWKTCVAGGGSAVLRVVHSPEKVSTSLEVLAAKLGISIPVLWKTCVAGGGSAVLRVVDSPEKVSTSLEVLAAKLGISVPVLWTIMTGSPNSVWVQCLDHSEDTAAIILAAKQSPHDLLKLQPPAFGNFWRNRSLREKALEALAEGHEWVRVKQTLESVNVNDQNFDELRSTLTRDTCKSLYTSREELTKRRKKEDVQRNFKCGCGKGYGAKKSLVIHQKKCTESSGSSASSGAFQEESDVALQCSFCPKPCPTGKHQFPSCRHCQTIHACSRRSECFEKFLVHVEACCKKHSSFL
jgi:biotin operon repressor